MTDKEIVAKACHLARLLAEFDGYTFPIGHLFFTDPSSRAQRYWALAALAFEEMRATDINDTLACLGLELAVPVLQAPVPTPKGRRRRFN